MDAGRRVSVRARTVYVESSALLRFLLGQEGGGDVLEAISGADTAVTHELTLIEAERVLAREQALGGVHMALRRRLLHQLADAWFIVPLSPAYRPRLAEPFPVEPVGTLDAFHVATIELAARTLPDLVVLTFDEQVAANARAFGLATQPAATT